MDVKAKADLLKARLQKLSSSEKENAGIQRKIRRNIRKLEKEKMDCK